MQFMWFYTHDLLHLIILIAANELEKELTWKTKEKCNLLQVKNYKNPHLHFRENAVRFHKI